MKNVLITGGLGYLGGRLFNEFRMSQPNDKIWIGSRNPVIDEEIIAAYHGVAGFLVTEWGSQKALESICEGIDIIIHLAAVDSLAAEKNPAAALEMNGVSTVRLLEAAVKQKVKRFIYLSTIHVYGAPLKGEISEHNCPVPIHPYATSHRAAEDVIYSASIQKKIEAVIIRLSNCFGAPLLKNVNCWNLAIPNLCWQAVTQKRLTLISNGMQEKDFIPMRDACRAIIHFSDIPKEELKEVIYNVGAGVSYTILAISQKIQIICKKLFGYDILIQKPELKQGEHLVQMLFLIRRLQEVGFQPKTTIDDEIIDLLHFCKANFYGSS